jgi:hypothetical protein
MTATPNVTKEGITVEAGQVWLDLDKRRNGREITITKVVEGKAYYAGKIGAKHVLVSRMHKNGAGFSLIGKKIAQP